MLLNIFAANCTFDFETKSQPGVSRFATFFPGSGKCNYNLYSCSKLLSMFTFKLHVSEQGIQSLIDIPIKADKTFTDAAHLMTS